MPGEASRAILLVDDEPVLARVASRVLSRAGYRVRTAVTAEEARLALEAGDPPDAVVLDATLCRRLGEELLSRMIESCGPPALVLTSGAELEPASARLLDRGRGRYLAKPFEPSQLLRTLREALSARESAP